MKKVKTLTIKFEPYSTFKARVRSALGNAKTVSTRVDTILFNSVADYQILMTPQRLAIIAAIAQKKPASMLRLAGLVERKVSEVRQDCVALQAMVIKLVDFRDVKIPVKSLTSEGRGYCRRPFARMVFTGLFQLESENGS